MEVTSGTQWRKGAPYQLPSGNVVALRRPSVFVLVADEDAPDFLRKIVLDQINNRKKPANGKGSEFEVTPENLPQLIKMLRKICVACFSSPRIVEHPTADDEISMEDVSDADQIAVFQWLIGGRLEAAQTFPEKPLGDVGAVSDGNGVQPEAVADDGGQA